MKLDMAWLSTADNSFEVDMRKLQSRGLEFDPKVDAQVQDIIARVRQHGDDEVLALTRKHDNHPAVAISELELDREQLKAATSEVGSEVREALEIAARRIRDFHVRQVEQSWNFEDDDGSLYGHRLNPISRVGVYAPGGQAAYPSSVLMSAVPAKVAGVSEVVVTAPAPNGEIKKSVLAAAYIAGIERMFTVGGAQAIAALAFGTRTIPRVDKIVGPGNAWVSAAKRQVFGHVGIDLVAGPSEVVVVCDDTANAQWAAMDLFAQAEHAEDTQSVLVSTSRQKMNEVHQRMQELLPGLERRDIIARAIAGQGAMVKVRDRDEMIDVIDRLAPEHLELMIENPMEVAERVRNAGAIFVGPYSAEVLGDYCAGPNHVLPTSGSARFSSPLGVYDFMKRTSIIACTAQGSRHLASTASVLAREEQLTAHARSAEYRLTNNE